MLVRNGLYGSFVATITYTTSNIDSKQQRASSPRIFKLLFLALYMVVTPADLQAQLAQVDSLPFTLCSVLTVKVGHNAIRCPFALRRVEYGASSTGVVCSLTTVRLLPSATAHTEEAAPGDVPQTRFPQVDPSSSRQQVRVRSVRRHHQRDKERHLGVTT